MTIYIDPPVWPAHGTLFSHLISDASLAELHAFAEATGISGRAFDRDHYDVPAHCYDDLIRGGARAVSGSELVRLLAASGLRVSTRERPEKVRRNLQASWRRLGAQLPGGALPRWVEAGEQLLDRWSEPHRSYHAPHHLAAVLRGVGIVQRAGELPAPLRTQVLLAAWYHDAVYAGSADQDEEESARLAEEELDGLLPAETVEEVGRLIRLTASHRPENDDSAGAALADADLEVLGRDRPAYLRYVRQVRADFDHIGDPDFARGRMQVLQRLLSAPRLFHTEVGYIRWEAAARSNLEDELSQLQRGAPPWRPAAGD